jgi:hypothetical protein
LGRIERLMLRMLIASDGWPIHVRDVLARAYPSLPRVNGHYVSLYKAHRRGKFSVRLRRGMIGPTRELERAIRGE